MNDALWTLQHAALALEDELTTVRSAWGDTVARELNALLRGVRDTTDAITAAAPDEASPAPHVPMERTDRLSSAIERSASRLALVDHVSAPDWQSVALHTESCRTHLSQIREAIRHAESGIAAGRAGVLPTPGRPLPPPWAPPTSTV